MKKFCVTLPLLVAVVLRSCVGSADHRWSHLDQNAVNHLFWKEQKFPTSLCERMSTFQENHGECRLLHHVGQLVMYLVIMAVHITARDGAHRRSVSVWHSASTTRTGRRGTKTNTALQLIGPAADTFVTAPARCQRHIPLRVPQRLPKEQALQRKAAHSHSTPHRAQRQDRTWHFRSHSVPWPSRFARRARHTPRTRVEALCPSIRFAERHAPSTSRLHMQCGRRGVIRKPLHDPIRTATATKRGKLCAASARYAAVLAAVLHTPAASPPSRVSPLAALASQPAAEILRGVALQRCSPFPDILDTHATARVVDRSSPSSHTLVPGGRTGKWTTGARTSTRTRTRCRNAEVNRGRRIEGRRQDGAPCSKHRSGNTAPVACAVSGASGNSDSARAFEM
ncbi:hypothetical protein, conserved in T. vivax [Trypanosoma vivax Y486]|uniref:Secreted protein n=1 Tax=Trypanosoma vivax (strain Y486) TaxID=1055687 RepID=F9WM72_TRYVY|nr:hypothetical protein, conserved in T. vivax [Trypanosoma vivax Y486]|eukprot:CCD18623.1 hypothetical protein, conserved in T. vivax [Trypanosoma vivax Y486]